MTKFLRKKIFYLFGAITLILIAGGLVFLRKKGTKNFIAHSVKRCNIVQLVSVTGSLKPAKEITLAAQIAGQVKKVYFKEGAHVREGEVIVKLDDRDILAKIKETKASLRQLQANLDKLLAGPKKEEVEVYKEKVKTAEKNLKEAQDNLVTTKKVALANLENLYRGVYNLILGSLANADDAVNAKLDPLFVDDTTDPKLSFSVSDFNLKTNIEFKREEINQLLEEWQKEVGKLSPSSSFSEFDLALQSSENYLSQIESIFSLLREALNKAPGLSPDQRTSYKDLVNLAENEVLSSLSSVASKREAIKVQKTINEKQIRGALNAYQIAKSNLELAKKQLELITSPPREEDVKQLQAQIEAAKAGLNYYLNQLSKTEIRAPLDGIISDLPVEVGDFVGVGQRVAGFISPDKKEVEVNVSEADITKVKVGQKAVITFDALGPQEKFDAKVIYINPAPTVISGVVYYKVKLILEKNDPRLKPGMTANIDIITGKKENALCLPFQFLEEKDHKKFVHLLSADGKIVEKEVKIGLEGETNLEVLEGLKEGDKVVLFLEKK